MKFTIEAEDALIGIICGGLLLGLAGKFFSLKLHDSVYVIAFGLFIIFIVLDIINEFKDISSLGLIFLSILHNLVDFVISLAFISHFTRIDIPYVTQYLVPYLQSPEIIAGMGIFLVVTNTLWLITMPFWI